MKRISTYFIMMLTTVMTMSLTGCSEDQLIGMDLEGTWEGRTYAYHSYDGQLYQSSRTVLTFGTDWDHFTQGSGYWVDYYSSSPWGRDYVANHIRWRVSGGIIYIHFREDNYDIEIHDYRLNNGHFEGTIYTADGTTVDFVLYKTSDRNWESDYYYGYDYYYSKETRAAGDSIAAEAPKRMFIPDAAK